MPRKLVKDSYRGWYGWEAQFNSMLRMSIQSMYSTNVQNQREKHRHRAVIQTLSDQQKRYDVTARSDFLCLRQELLEMTAYGRVYKQYSFHRAVRSSPSRLGEVKVKGKQPPVQVAVTRQSQEQRQLSVIDTDSARQTLQNKALRSLEENAQSGKTRTPHNEMCKETNKTIVEKLNKDVTQPEVETQSKPQHSPDGDAGTQHSLDGDAGKHHSLDGGSDTQHSLDGGAGTQQSLDGDAGKQHSLDGSSGTQHALYGDAGTQHSPGGYAGTQHSPGGHAGTENPTDDAATQKLMFQSVRGIAARGSSDQSVSTGCNGPGGKGKAGQQLGVWERVSPVGTHRKLKLFPGECNTAFTFRRLIDKKAQRLVADWSPENARKQRVKKILVSQPGFPELVQRSKTTSAIFRDFQKYKQSCQDDVTYASQSQNPLLRKSNPGDVKATQSQTSLPRMGVSGDNSNSHNCLSRIGILSDVTDASQSQTFLPMMGDPGYIIAASQSQTPLHSMGVTAQISKQQKPDTCISLVTKK